MSDLRVSIRLEKDSYRPLETLVGAFQITGVPPDRYSIEVSVLWRTEGKGDEDLGVIFFREWTPDREPFDFGSPKEFDVALPRTPWSYDGVLVKIHWLARMRVRWASEYEAVAEEAFRLCPAHAVAS